MTGRRRTVTGLIILSALGVAGTLWYWALEHYGFIDAAYQTTTTITTVGFGEERPFDTSAKVFSIFLMIFGVAAALYTFGGVVEELVETQFAFFGRRRMDRRINRLEGHTVVCGFGRVGSRIAQRLGAEDRTSVVVVDASAEKCNTAGLEGHLVVHGDTTEDAVLTMAGVDRASTLVVCLGSDADAISTVLSARVLNPRLRIVARANAETSEPKLQRAGVDRVVNPLSSGAQRLAAFAQQPAVADFLDVVVHDGSLEYRLEEVQVHHGSKFVGTSLADAHIRSATGALILALRDADGQFHNNPSPQTVLQPGTTMIAIGTNQQLATLEDYFEVQAAPN